MSTPKEFALLLHLCIPLDEEVIQLALSQPGKRVYLASGDYHVSSWDMAPDTSLIGTELYSTRIYKASNCQDNNDVHPILRAGRSNPPHSAPAGTRNIVIERLSVAGTLFKGSFCFTNLDHLLASESYSSRNAKPVT